MAILVAVMLGLGITNIRLMDHAPGGNEFLARWMGARAWLLRGADPYDHTVQLQAQRLYYGRAAEPSAGEDPLLFLYPFPTLLLYLPLGALDFGVARALWMTVLELCVVLIAFLGARLVTHNPPRWMLILYGLFGIAWYHGFRALIAGDLAFWPALLMSGALLAIREDLDGLAGFLLAMSLANPIFATPVVLLTEAYAISHRRWRVVLSTLGTVAIVLIISLVMLPEWPLLWLRQLVEYAKLVPLKSGISIIGSAIPQLSTWLTIGLYGIAVSYMVWEWLQTMRKREQWLLWTASVSIVLLSLLAFQPTTQNLVFLLPVIFVVFGWWRQRWVSSGTAGPIAALLIFALVPWGIYLANLENRQESAALYLFAPMVLLFILWWLRWWATSSIELKAVVGRQR